MLFLTSYLEDLVSGSELWNSFVRKHTKLYDKPLPFYVTEDYAEEEINNEDICFLIWYFMGLYNSGRTIYYSGK